MYTAGANCCLDTRVTSIFFMVVFATQTCSFAIPAAQLLVCQAQVCRNCSITTKRKRRLSVAPLITESYRGFSLSISMQCNYKAEPLVHQKARTMVRSVGTSGV